MVMPITIGKRTSYRHLWIDADRGPPLAGFANRAHVSQGSHPFVKAA